jgi:Transglutaminase-like superfamily
MRVTYTGKYRRVPSDLLLESTCRISAEALRHTDPLVLNLIVARGCPTVRNVDMLACAHQLDLWAGEVQAILPAAEDEFHASPGDWKHDLAFFRLGLLCWFIDEVLHIRYRDDLREAEFVRYTDPRDLFLHGLIETRRGTCATMPALHVALGWRLGWPVALAVAGWHVLCRYDDGERTHNIEATRTGGGGFHSHPDHDYMFRYGITEADVRSGSDLTTLDPRRMLGLFVGFRARHLQDVGQPRQAARDYELALNLFPGSQLLRRKGSELTVFNGSLRP